MWIHIFGAPDCCSDRTRILHIFFDDEKIEIWLVPSDYFYGSVPLFYWACNNFLAQSCVQPQRQNLDQHLGWPWSCQLFWHHEISAQIFVYMQVEIGHDLPQDCVDYVLSYALYDEPAKLCLTGHHFRTLPPDCFYSYGSWLPNDDPVPFLLLDWDDTCTLLLTVLSTIPRTAFPLDDFVQFSIYQLFTPCSAPTNACWSITTSFRNNKQYRFLKNST